MRLRVKIVIIVVSVLAMIGGMLIFTVAPKFTLDEQLNMAKKLPLEKDKYPEVTALINKFINAKFEMDMKTLEECVNNINVSEYKKEELEKKSGLVESIESITCYTIDGFYDDSYIVLVYTEEKLNNMDVVAPAVVMYYVCKYEGRLVVFSGDADEKAGLYYDNAKENPEVKALVDKAQNRVSELEKEYPEYKELMDKMSSNATPTPKPTSTPKPKSTNEDESVG